MSKVPSGRWMSWSFTRDDRNDCKNDCRRPTVTCLLPTDPCLLLRSPPPLATTHSSCLCKYIFLVLNFYPSCASCVTCSASLSDMHASFLSVSVPPCTSFHCTYPLLCAISLATTTSAAATTTAVVQMLLHSVCRLFAH